MRGRVSVCVLLYGNLSYRQICVTTTSINVQKPSIPISSLHVYVCARFCPTLCDPRGCRPRNRIFPAKVLEWVVICSCRGSSWPSDWTLISYVSCILRQILYYATWESQGSLFNYSFIATVSGLSFPLIRVLEEQKILFSWGQCIPLFIYSVFLFVWVCCCNCCIF